MVRNEIATHTLSEEEFQTLLSIVVEEHGLAVAHEVFVDVILGLFEDIPGFETMPPAKADHLVNQLWSTYMSKKPVASNETDQDAIEAAALAAKPSKPIEIDLDRPTIRAAIERGQSLLTDGKSKADSARAIFNEMTGEPKEVIVAAFVAGASLTEKGALTYWYNCRRKAAKEAAQKA